MKNKILPVVALTLVLVAVLVGVLYFQKDRLPFLSGQTNQDSASNATNSESPGANTAAGGENTGSQNGSAPGNNEEAMSNPNADLTIDEATGLSKAVVTMTTDKGVIKFKFYSKDAPATSRRITQLIQQKFYDGLTFHRVVPGFVVQGGDPTGLGTGGSGQKLKAEFNQRKHVEGAVAMARASDPNSADSQFYITLGSFPHLDGNYTIFGQVIEGLEVAKKLEVGDKMTNVIVQ